MQVYKVCNSLMAPIFRVNATVLPTGIVHMVAALVRGVDILGGDVLEAPANDSGGDSSISALKEAFAVNNHSRIKKEFTVSCHRPFGKTSGYTML